MKFLAAVSHSMGAHTETLCLTADSISSSNDEDETYEASSATTPESSQSPKTAAVMLMFALKNTKILTNKVRSLPVLYYAGR